MCSSVFHLVSGAGTGVGCGGTSAGYGCACGGSGGQD